MSAIDPDQPDVREPSTPVRSIDQQRKLFLQRLPGIGLAPADATRLRVRLEDSPSERSSPAGSSPVTPLLGVSPPAPGVMSSFLPDDAALEDQPQGGNWRVRKLDLKVLGALPEGSTMIVRRHSSPWLMAYNTDEIVMADQGVRGRSIEFLPDGDELREVPALLEALNATREGAGDENDKERRSVDTPDVVP